MLSSDKSPCICVGRLLTMLSSGNSQYVFEGWLLTVLSSGKSQWVCVGRLLIVLSSGNSPYVFVRLWRRASYCAGVKKIPYVFVRLWRTATHSACVREKSVRSILELYFALKKSSLRAVADIFWKPSGVPSSASRIDTKFFKDFDILHPPMLRWPAQEQPHQKLQWKEQPECRSWHLLKESCPKLLVLTRIKNYTRSGHRIFKAISSRAWQDQDLDKSKHMI